MKLTVFTATLVLLVGVSVNASAAGDPERGRLKAATCMGCHGAPGMRNAYPGYRVPKLGGQHAQYLADALKGYRAGLRAHPTMRAQAATLTDEDIADIAAYFAAMSRSEK